VFEGYCAIEQIPVNLPCQKLCYIDILNPQSEVTFFFTISYCIALVMSTVIDKYELRN